MAKVIIFGGGDGGGIRITPNGIKPIPPFGPPFLFQIRALNELAHAFYRMREKDSVRLLGDVITKLTGAVLTQLEAQVGEIDADNGLIYQGMSGGFSCGSTGKPPIPFPWPVDPRRTVVDMVSRGILDTQTISFLEQAADHKVDVFTVAQNPRAAASRIGVNLTPEVEQSLLTLNLDKSKIENPIDKEIIEFYLKVVHDGRYIADWVVDPAMVSERLKLKVSQLALDRVFDIRDFGLQQVGSSLPAYAVAVVIVIVIIAWTHEVELPVIDRSGIAKL